jgi:hypothetical protein
MNTAANGVPVRAGHPRLVVATGGRAAAGSPEAAGIQQAFTLDGDVVTIGSADNQDVRLPGLDPEHAVIRRTADARAAGGMAKPPNRASRSTFHTGRFTVF